MIIFIYKLPNYLLLFTTKEVLRWCQSQPCRGWREMAQQGVEIHEVPGTHLSMIGEPGVQILAEKLIFCIEQAQGTGK
ncbi:MAG: hypothetical protein VKL60_01795 [Sphaerospermopsis sp.]|nr:hypothetical protein [Sphaerospermopsis sp.]